MRPDLVHDMMMLTLDDLEAAAHIYDHGQDMTRRLNMTDTGDNDDAKLPKVDTMIMIIDAIDDQLADMRQMLLDMQKQQDSAG